MKRGVFALMALGIVMLPATGQADQYQQRVITTTTLIGATAGAVIGSGQNQTAQGAIVGGLLGAVTGAIISQNRPQPIAYEAHRWDRDDYDEYREHAWREQQRRRAAHRRHEWREHERREHRRVEQVRVLHKRHCNRLYGCPDNHHYHLQRISYHRHPVHRWYED